MSPDSRIQPLKLSKKQLMSLLGGEDDQWLFSQADILTRAVFSDQVYLRGIVEFSNLCRHDCHYCGLRRSNRAARRYRLSEACIIEAAETAIRLGMGSIVLQSGDDYRYRLDDIRRVIAEIKARANVAITLSLGDRHTEELQAWRDAGADRYLLKMETFNRMLFSQLRPGADFDARINRLLTLKRLGYQTGSGIITGLPGMTDSMLADDLLTLTELELDMLACGPFVAHPQTPLGQARNGSVLQSHRVSALLRLMNPGANIPATSSLEALEPGSREQALTRGCNVVMPSFTPENVYDCYGIYPGKNSSTLTLESRVKALRNAIAATGRHPSNGRGDSLRTQYV
ncbi:iron-only hydrogenase maturation protein HydE [Ferrimonas balearica DSM 9799]|uniref:Iron-only hydrogenase maturation protein HydE n=1 Tax=Ferrimonas balearica (strain DSM 9799 / CCM 4581 / KCTC 23876 / PAT) TaxID=550540 RepID=E1SUC0_FERBD|nr:[FeFe] hydrogenase H-cluster radical SAM maturase HydE [Ferrimonas balearica]ADN76253.1 iron-only hydrogenase maturation protein HydE [Ferrimonas balearica DSM 9799]